jgi:hypothetical protein
MAYAVDVTYGPADRLAVERTVEGFKYRYEAEWYVKNKDWSTYPGFVKVEIVDTTGFLIRHPYFLST